MKSPIKKCIILKVRSKITKSETKVLKTSSLESFSLFSLQFCQKYHFMIKDSWLPFTAIPADGKIVGAERLQGEAQRY